MWTRHDFFYELPEELIAQTPLVKRTASRLLVVKNETELDLLDKQFSDLLDFLKPNDHIVFNNTKVIPARIYGQKATGGKVELLLERCLSETEALVHIKASRAPKANSQLHFTNECVVTVLEKKDHVYRVEFDRDILSFLEIFGHMPLPPYIERDDTEDDQMRYQTVFAKELGAVAAPTASLHFDKSLLEKIRSKGVKVSELTLHVGAGTFQPVRTDNLEEHIMHAEWLHVPQAVVDSIQQTKELGGRVIAIGTTVVRSLETASQSGQLQAFQGESQLFIYPGYEFKTVDVILTNFHLPESTLLMLVSAFAGYTEIKRVYQHAIKQKYRFFSYGDAMLLLNKNSAIES